MDTSEYQGYYKKALQKLALLNDNELEAFVKNDLVIKHIAKSKCCNSNITVACCGHCAKSCEIMIT